MCSIRLELPLSQLLPNTARSGNKRPPAKLASGMPLNQGGSIEAVGGLLR